MFRRASSLIFLALTPLLFACTKTEGAKGAQTEKATSDAPRHHTSQALSEKGQGELLGRFAAGTFGPRHYRDGANELVFWAVPNGQDKGLYAEVISPDGLAKKSVRLADAPEGLRFFEANFAPGGDLFVYLVHEQGGNHFITVLSVSPEGALVTVPYVALESPAEPLWASSFSTPKGQLLFWAERSSNGADIYVRPFRTAATPGEARRVVRGAASWQAVAAYGKWFLVTVEVASGGKNLVVRLLGEDAALALPPKTVTEKVRGGEELEVIAENERLVVVFGEKAPFGSRLVRAALSPRLEVLKTLGPLTRPRGDQILTGLLRDEKSGALVAAWEEPERGRAGTRHIFFGPLGGPEVFVDAPLLEMETFGNDPLLPSLALRDGIVYYLAEVAVPCEGSKCGSKLVSGRTALQRDHAEARSFCSPSEAGLTWDFQLGPRGPETLVASREESPLVYLLATDRCPEDPARPLRPLKAEALPRVVSEEVLGEVPELSALRATPTGEGVLLSWLSYFDPSTPPDAKGPKAPDGKAAPMRAWVKNQLFHLAPEEQSLSLKGENVISYRARSLGGLSVAGAKDGKHLLGWAALDGKEPGLFLTLIDGVGKKVEQKMLRKGPFEITDIATLRVGDGYLVAWVESGAEKPAIFAARVDEKLKLVGSEVKLGEGRSAPTDLSLVLAGDHALLAYAEDRSTDSSGKGDLFLLSLRPENAEPIGFPRRLLSTERHSFAPTLLAGENGGDAPLLAWIESGLSAAEESHFQVAALGADGRFSEEPVRVELPGKVRSYSFVRNGNQKRLVVSVDNDGRGELWGAVLGSKQPAKLLSALVGPASQAVAPALVGNVVYYVDHKVGSPHLLHAMTLAF